MGTLLSSFTELLRSPLIIWKNEIEPLSPYITFSITIYNFITLAAVFRVIHHNYIKSNMLLWLISFMVIFMSFLVKFAVISNVTLFVLKNYIPVCAETQITLFEIVKHVSFWK